jgi:hypothetical protein
MPRSRKLAEFRSVHLRCREAGERLDDLHVLPEVTEVHSVSSLHSRP